MFLSQVECSARGLTQKKAGFPCSGLNLGSCFKSQDEGMSESPVESLEKVKSSPPHLDRGNHITLIPQEAHGIQGI